MYQKHAYDVDEMKQRRDVVRLQAVDKGATKWSK